MPYLRVRKKPIEVDAIKNNGEWPPILGFLDNVGYVIRVGHRPSITRDPETGVLTIETLKGTVKCEVGSWLIRGIKGELYPIRDDVFQETYEVV